MTHKLVNLIKQIVVPEKPRDTAEPPDPERVARLERKLAYMQRRLDLYRQR